MEASRSKDRCAPPRGDFTHRRAWARRRAWPQCSRQRAGSLREVGARARGAGGRRWRRPRKRLARGGRERARRAPRQSTHARAAGGTPSPPTQNGQWAQPSCPETARPGAAACKRRGTRKAEEIKQTTKREEGGSARRSLAQRSSCGYGCGTHCKSFHRRLQRSVLLAAGSERNSTGCDGRERRRGRVNADADVGARHKSWQLTHLARRNGRSRSVAVAMRVSRVGHARRHGRRETGAGESAACTPPSSRRFFFLRHFRFVLRLKRRRAKVCAETSYLSLQTAARLTFDKYRLL